ncbi:glycerate 2-kinase [Desulfosarcina sp. BuS5]|uniref:glycerate kinase type-2 family protein n=1 Tax=Desulfosarcina sp. BuS5 TaxID=933262 RepID=UPI000481BAE7|nr:glycerate kinase [Desulfosarcina sp. BuS5]WDN89012.1 glycerate 2-kinase [Desulfosarcina sp. BuS5]
MNTQNKELNAIRSDAREIFRNSLMAVDPYKAVKRFIHIEGDRLLIGMEGRPEAELDLAEFDRIALVGAGKAAAPMARGIEELFGKKIRKGLINVKYGFTEKLAFTGIIESGHPVPDKNGVKGTEKILDFLRRANEKDLIFSLISGGGSALLPQPARNITLSEKQKITRDLLACGACIDEINAIRKHISSSKGGQMARAAFPASIVNLMLSDVVGDKMDVIASGPFVPDTSTFKDAWGIFKKYDLKGIPAAIHDHIKLGLEGQIPETPKENDKIFDRVLTYIVGSNILALEAASAMAKKLGYRTLILSSMVEGETKEIARVHTAIAKEILKTGRPIPPPACIISGGETTVTIRGDGLGGRNQEFCLASALDLIELPPRVVLLSGGTDGNDGPTDAAGAMVDPLTVTRGKNAGMPAERFLDRNDAYHFLNKTKDLLMTGPTNTNVMDVRLVLVR